MADISLKLHSASRKYCIEQHAYWATAYVPISEKHGVDYTNEGYNVFPRYQAAEAILSEVEKIDADNLPSFQELSKLLIEAGKRASSIFIESPSNEIIANAITEEKEKFSEYVSSLTEKLVINIEPMPYRHILSAREVASVWKSINKRWGIDSPQYWYPIGNKTEDSLAAFDTSIFNEKIPLEKLRNIIRDWGVKRLWELRESGTGDCCLSVDLWKPHYNGDEGYWISENHDWIMYISHEGTTTVGGRLRDEIQKLWPDAPEFNWEHQQ